MTASIDPSVYTDMQSLAQLRGKVRADGSDQSPETLRKVAGQFEAMFINMMLKTMRESSLGEGLMDNDQTKFYQGMYDQQISQELTKGKGLGLADMLVRQLGGASAAEATGERPRMTTDPFLGPAMSGRKNVAQAGLTQPQGMDNATAADATAVSGSPSQWRPASREDFVADLWPHAERAAQTLGVDPRALLAQAALETGWGQHIMQQGRGRSSHNLFGIKADSRWSGPQAISRTVEYRDGILQREQASFRAYASPAESMADYAEFIRSNPRYKDALEVSDPAQYLTELQSAGYATDPNYATKIMSIFNSDQFQMAVADAKYQARQAATGTEEIAVLNTQPEAELNTDIPVSDGEV